MPVFTAALLTVASSQKVATAQQPNLSTDEWINKSVVYTCNGILFSLRKECNLVHTTTWMDFADIMLSKIS